MDLGFKINFKKFEKHFRLSSKSTSKINFKKKKISEIRIKISDEYPLFFFFSRENDPKGSNENSYSMLVYPITERTPKFIETSRGVYPLKQSSANANARGKIDAKVAVVPREMCDGL